jgi:hypothetical protein
MKNSQINEYYKELSFTDKLNIAFSKFFFSNEQKADLLEDLAKWLQDGTSVMDAIRSWAQYNKDGSKYIAEAVLWANSNSKFGLYDGLTGWYDPSVIVALQKASSKEKTVQALSLSSEIIRNSGGFLLKFCLWALLPLLMWTVGFVFRGFGFTHFGFNVVELFTSFGDQSKWTLPISSFVDGVYSARIYLWLFPLLFVGMIVLYNYIMRYKAFGVYKDILASKFLQGLATLTANGVRLKDALHFLNRKSSPFVKKHIDEMLGNINVRGLQNNAEIIDTGFIPPEIIGRYKVLSQSSSGNEALVKSSLRLAENSGTRALKALKFVAFALLFCAVAYLAMTYIGLQMAIGEIKKII